MLGEFHKRFELLKKTTLPIRTGSYQHKLKANTAAGHQALNGRDEKRTDNTLVFLFNISNAMLRLDSDAKDIRSGKIYRSTLSIL